MKRVHPLMGHPPPNHDVGRVVMACLHPWHLLLHLIGCFSINLAVLVAVLLLGDEDFLFLEEDVFVTILGVPLEETLCSCLSDLLHSQSKEVSLQPLVGCRV
jgi:hypothetical protein